MLEEERNRSERVAWGTGRVVVRANLRAIQGLLDEGWPLTTVYQRVKNSLAGLSYRQFSEHLRRHLRSTSKQPTKKQAPTQSNALAQTTSIIESLAQRGPANGEKPKPSGQPAKQKLRRSSKSAQSASADNANASSESPYQVLGLEIGASQDEVIAAYRRLTKMYHPDRVSGLGPEFAEIAERKMKQLNAAYEELQKKFA